MFSGISLSDLGSQKLYKCVQICIYIYVYVYLSINVNEKKYTHIQFIHSYICIRMFHISLIMGWVMTTSQKKKNKTYQVFRPQIFHPTPGACCPPAQKSVAAPYNPPLPIGKPTCRTHMEVGRTVDGSEIPNNHLGCIKPCTVNNGINYRPQLVQDFLHQQYHPTDLKDIE